MRDQRPFYRSPVFQTWLVIILSLVFFLYLLVRANQMVTPWDILRSGFYFLLLRFGRIPTRVWLLLFDIILLIVGIFFWLGIFSQFILPVINLKDRSSAFNRLLVYFSGMHGPALFIENGKVHERKEEARQRGPGVVILDTASAAVLRDDFKFTRKVGPGVVFTRKNEYLAKSVDLHTRAAKLGPLGEEDPFKPLDLEDEIETEEMYEQRHLRRTQTSGLTRDGVEVVPNVQVVYRLKRRSGDKSFTFGYNPISVQQWVTADGPLHTTPMGDKDKWDNIPLEQLPAYIAVDLWREYLQRFTLNQLFSSPIRELERGETAYSVILRQINNRLTKPIVSELNAVGEPTNRQVASREFITLRERGISVLGASVSNLRFDPSIETRLVQQWVTSWLQRAQTERNLVERQRSYAALTGRRQALERFAMAAIQQFDQDLLSLPRPLDDREELVQMKAALDRLVEGTLNGSLEPAFVHLMQLEETNLRDLLAWIGGQEV